MELVPYWLGGVVEIDAGVVGVEVGLGAGVLAPAGGAS
jgi:hypothetical protein